MTPQCEWFVICERVIQDAQTNLLTLVDCLEQLRSAEFPYHHHGFAFAATYRVSIPPEQDQAIHHRFVRFSEVDPEETIVEFAGNWRAGTTRTRLVASFGVLRLRRPETIHFRLDHRVGEGGWFPGPVRQIDVVRLELSPEQRQRTRAEYELLGLEIPEFLKE